MFYVKDTGFEITQRKDTRTIPHLVARETTHLSIKLSRNRYLVLSNAYATNI